MEQETRNITLCLIMFLFGAIMIGAREINVLYEAPVGFISIILFAICAYFIA